MTSVVIVSPLSARIGAYLFVGVGGSATLVGFFTDEGGYQEGRSFEVEVSDDEAAALPDIPKDAVGAVLQVKAGSVAYSPGGKPSDILEHPDRFPVIAGANGFVRLGRVAA